MQTNYVDLSGMLPMGGVTLAKVSEPQYDLRKIGTVRLSRPVVFRTTGEVLVNDEQEGEARTESRDTVEEPEDSGSRSARPGASGGNTSGALETVHKERDGQVDENEDRDREGHVWRRLVDLQHVGVARSG